MPRLTQSQIDEFIEFGVLVVPDVLDKHEIESARAAFHAELATYGVIHENLKATAGNLKKLSSTGGAGGILDLFYPSWRLSIAEHPKIFQVISELWEATYACGHADESHLFHHPFGEFNPRQGMK